MSYNNDRSNSFSNKKSFKAPVVASFAAETVADPDDLERDTWNPSKADMKAFLAKDYQHAQFNVQHALAGRNYPISLREIKESSLHSFDVIERVLSSKIASGLVSESNGKYFLVKP